MMINSEKVDILSLYPQELGELITSLGEKAFRAKQVFNWLHQQNAATFSQMGNLPLPLRESLESHCYITRAEELRRQVARDSTTKFLFRLHDGNTIESVLMTHSYGNSLCISTQAGCRMGCKFCASAIGGKARDLTAGEMLSQIYQAAALTNRRVDSLVLMGIGEPLDNMVNLLRFLELVKHPDGLNLSHRHIALSTCGIVPMIDELATHRLQLTLSVSLHASDNATRSAIMPVNDAYPIEQLMGACKRYFRNTHRRISYEYALISGINDTVTQAEALAKLLKGQGCHINLIPVNPVREAGFTRTDREHAAAFQDVLVKAGFEATIRRELGAEIDAACGQLRQNDWKENL